MKVIAFKGCFNILIASEKEIFCLCLFTDSLSPPVNVTITAVKANSAVVTWDIPEGDPVIGFAITQQVSHALGTCTCTRSPGLMILSSSVLASWESSHMLGAVELGTLCVSSSMT